MRMYDIIEKKKRNLKLTESEIKFFVNGVTNGEIPDYQTSALLMAIYFNGMTDTEMTTLTTEMEHSGDITDLSSIDGVTVDKHSTGGVGDTVTLIVAPIAATLGCKVAKMSGRGLGHTGGTIDKLESIPGFKTTIPMNDFISQVNDIGLSVIGQSGNLVPADKKLYALRDVTATVDSIPLIASSIMSKKLAAGAKNIVLDVKYGSGAFMKDLDSAKLLAQKMIAIGKNANRNISAVVSPMNTPLGDAVGNSLEVIEAINVLNGGGSKNLRELSIVLSALMLSLSSNKDFEECKKLATNAIDSKKALEKFKELVKAQGGDTKYIDNPTAFDTAKNVVPYVAKRDGYISSTDCEEIGMAAMKLGAGRAVKDDEIDMSAGIVFSKKLGEKVKKGEIIATLYTNKNYDESIKILDNAIKISDKQPTTDFNYIIL